MIKFKGVMPALITPLNADETLNAEVYKKLIGDLMKKGAYGFYAGGATGEGIALRREVREQLAFEAVKAADKKVPVIVHIASADFSEAKELAKQAESVGASAISAIPPLFFAYDENDIYNYYKELASCVNIPLVIYYNLAAGFKFSADFAAKLFEIDNITAIKWTCSDYFGMMRLKDITNGEMNIINGPDEMLLMGLCAGADGGIGTTYNYQFDTIKEVYESFISGDIEKARKAQYLADRRIYKTFKYECIPAAKAILERQGYNVGNAAFPMKKYTEEEKTKIYNEVFAN